MDAKKIAEALGATLANTMSDAMVAVGAPPYYYFPGELLPRGLKEAEMGLFPAWVPLPSRGVDYELEAADRRAAERRASKRATELADADFWAMVGPDGPAFLQFCADYHRATATATDWHWLWEAYIAAQDAKDEANTQADALR